MAEVPLVADDGYQGVNGTSQIIGFTICTPLATAKYRQTALLRR
jgi:hypothetical protein